MSVRRVLPVRGAVLLLATVAALMAVIAISIASGSATFAGHPRPAVADNPFGGGGSSGGGGASGGW